MRKTLKIKIVDFKRSLIKTQTFPLAGDLIMNRPAKVGGTAGLDTGSSRKKIART